MPKIALIQLSADARPAVNKEKTEAAIREAAANGAQIICTQELFTTNTSAERRNANCSTWRNRFPEN